jgi:glutamate synthase (NADPH/NADH) large chain
MDKLRNIEKHTGGKFRSHELDITYPAAWGKEGIEARLASLCAPKPKMRSRGATTS